MDRRQFLKTVGATSASTLGPAFVLDELAALAEPFPGTADAVLRPLLGMRALGAQGLAPEVENGNHLRWQISPAIGFPQFGFDLYRREHVAGTPQHVTLTRTQSSQWVLSEPLRRVQVRLRMPVAVAMVRAMYAGGVMAEKSAIRGPDGVALIDFQADAIDALQMPAGATILQSLGVPWRQDVGTGWGAPLNGATRIGLPLSDPSYPCSIGSADPWTLAESRLRRANDAGVLQPLLPDLERQRYETEFTKLLGELSKSLAPEGNKPVELYDETDSETSIRISPRQLVFMSAIDPNIARILGLLYIDRSAPIGTPYDYMLRGHWSDHESRPGEQELRFRAASVGERYIQGSILVGTSQEGDSSDNLEPPGTPTRAARALIAFQECALPSPVQQSLNAPGQYALSLEALVKAPVVLRFEPAAQRIIIRAGANDQLLAEALDPSGAVVAQAQMPAGATQNLVLAARTITAVRLTSKREAEIISIQWTTASSGVRSLTWVCSKVTRGISIALPAPAEPVANGFQVGPADEEEFLTRPGALRTLRRQLAVGISWTLPPSTVVPDRQAVLYHVYRRKLGNGTKPPPLPSGTDSQFERITEEKDDDSPFVQPLPVRPLSRKTTLLSSMPWGWPERPRFLIDEVDQRWNAYAVEACDVFGRRSTRAVVLADARDDRAPPPPVGLRARYVEKSADTYDSNHDASFSALITTDAGAAVLYWDWPPGSFRQAPDAREFRVYAQPSRLNTLEGRVTAVTTSVDQSVLSVTLSGATLSTPLQEAWVRVGDAYYTVLGSETGAAPRITVRNRRLQANAAGQWGAPSMGACLIGIGGPGTRDGVQVGPDPNYRDFRLTSSWEKRETFVPLVTPLEGEATDVSEHGLSGTIVSTESGQPAGTVVVRTDRQILGAEELFVGGTFVAGTQTYTITSATLGPEARFVVKADGGGGTIAPSGSFTVTAPHLREVATNITQPPGMDLGSSSGGTLVSLGGEHRVLAVYPQGTPPKLVFSIESPEYVPPPAEEPASDDEEEEPAPEAEETDTAEDESEEVPEEIVAGACAWFPGYRLILSLSWFTIASDQTSVFASVGITTADDRSDKPDARGQAARYGNEGAVCAAQPITRTSRAVLASPPAPTFYPDPNNRLASPPDFNGHTWCTLTWPAVVGARYHVHRAAVASILMRDRLQRRAKTGYYASHDPFADDSGFTAWFATYSATTGITTMFDTAGEPQNTTKQRDAAWNAWAERFYAGAEEDEARVAALVTRTGNDSVFVQITTTAIEVNRFSDSLDGRSPARFVYRVLTFSLADRPGAATGASSLFTVPGNIRPTTPMISSAVGGDGKATITWAQGAGTRQVKYRLFRAESMQDARDVRLMTQIYETALLSPAIGSVSRDDPAEGGHEYYYRLVAVDAQGSASTPSPMVGVRVFDLSVPAAPTLTTGTRSTDVVTLAWTSASKVRVKVFRRKVNTLDWRAASSWLQFGTTSFVDRSAYAGVAYEYRLDAESAAGKAAPPGAFLQVP
jgi:hypothetical protein